MNACGLFVNRPLFLSWLAPPPISRGNRDPPYVGRKQESQTQHRALVVKAVQALV